MNTDIGEPIDYNPNDLKNDEPVSEQDQQLYYMHHPQPPQEYVQPPPVQNDFFSHLDKTAYIIIFVAFILGFFMGKTMQPVILRPS